MSTVKSGILYIVATPIGHLDDFSSRAISILKQADLICAEDTRQSQRLLQEYSIKNKLLSLHEHNESQRYPMVIDALQKGANVALISDAGTPLISDPGYLLVKACRQFGIKVSPIPGACAFVSALSVAGIATDQFRYLGFAPRKGARKKLFTRLQAETMTLVFYESSHRIKNCLADLVAALGEKREAAVCRELTKIHETVYTGNLGELVAQLEADSHGDKGEFVIVIAGQEKQPTQVVSDDVEVMLKRLMQDLPLKKAAAITAELTGLKKNILYQHGLTLD